MLIYAEIHKIAANIAIMTKLCVVNAGFAPAIGFDNYLGGRLAARYLLEGGHTRIGIVTGDTAEYACSVTAESSSGYAGGAEVLSERSAVRTDVGIL